MRRKVNLGLQNLPPCGKCGAAKVVERRPGNVKVYCPNCDDISEKTLDNTSEKG